MGRTINYTIYAVIGFLIGAVFKLWLDIGLDPQQLSSEPLVGPIVFGLVGAIAAIVIAWFL